MHRREALVKAENLSQTKFNYNRNENESVNGMANGMNGMTNNNEMESNHNHSEVNLNHNIYNNNTTININSNNISINETNNSNSNNHNNSNNNNSIVNGRGRIQEKRGESNFDLDDRKSFIAQEPRKWSYLDPNNNIQGEFSDSQMASWFRQRYFPHDLPVRSNQERQFTTLSELFGHGQSGMCVVYYLLCVCVCMIFVFFFNNSVFGGNSGKMAN